MDTKYSSTIVATSDISQRLLEVIARPPRINAAQVERVLEKCRSLQARGLIKKERYASPSTGDLQRLHMSQ